MISDGFTWKYDDPFFYKITVEEKDLDSYGHVNNAVYVKWLDECARAHSLEAGVDLEQIQTIGKGMAAYQTSITYHAAAYKNNELLVGEWITKNDYRLKATREFQIVRNSDKSLLLSASIDYVCINLKTGRPSKMPHLFKELYLCYSDK